MKNGSPSKYLVTKVSILWDGDRFGYPWRETFSEALFHGQQVVVVSPQCNDQCYGDLRRWAKVEPGLEVVDCEPLDKDIRSFGPTVMSAIKHHAKGKFIVNNGADELMEMGPFLKWIKDNRRALLDKPTLIKCWRWDFTYSSRLITELWVPRERLLISYGIARKWVGSHAVLNPSAGGFVRLNRKVEAVEYPDPVWHYNGLTSEQQHAVKHRTLCMSDQTLVAQAVKKFPEREKGNEIPLENCGWNYYKRPGGPSSRARPVPRKHPKVMWPWLSKAEMYWRDHEEKSS